MITTSAVCVCLFFGGWHIPWIDLIPAVANLQPDPANPSVTTSLIWCLIRAFVLFGKTLAVIGVFMWVRWSLPRFRFDQIMDLAWRALIPISLAQFFVTAFVIWFFAGTERAFMRVPGKMALVLLIANVVLLAVTMGVSTLIPAGPDTNRKIAIKGSRFARTPLPAGAASA
jgi:NADH-quinone oxidoreductase subunit H